jgi:hypothetical protein
MIRDNEVCYPSNPNSVLKWATATILSDGLTNTISYFERLLSDQTVYTLIVRICALMHEPVVQAEYSGRSGKVCRLGRGYVILNYADAMGFCQYRWRD